MAIRFIYPSQIIRFSVFTLFSFSFFFVYIFDFFFSSSLINTTSNFRNWFRVPYDFGWSNTKGTINGSFPSAVWQRGQLNTRVPETQLHVRLSRWCHVLVYIIFFFCEINRLKRCFSFFPILSPTSRTVSDRDRGSGR